jgi:2,3-dimethylmalate lyase
LAFQTSGSGAVRDILQAVDLPVLVDADDGDGDVKNVVHTVQTYERMGVGAIMIEDQTWPKRCGHMAGKSVIPIDDAEAKIRAAVAERQNPDTFILARTDARSVHGLDEALRRAARYLKAGAHGLFIEAPESVDEMAIIARRFDVPQLVNPLEGGRSPILSPTEYGELGFRMIGYGVTLLLRAAKAMQSAIEDIRRCERTDAGVSFEEFKDVVGFAEWARIEETYRVRRGT